jgi:predicted nuclease of restriction endonuclease-like (RecB) superfamily
LVRWSLMSETAVLPDSLASKMPDLPTHPPADAPEPVRSYDEFLEDIKGRIRSAQARAARAINAELIDVYWQIGQEILRRQAEEGNIRGRGGPKIVERLSTDLRAAFPGARGYSVSSLRYMRAFAAAWPEREMLQSGTGALPWGHIMLLLDKLSDRATRDWYAAHASSWSGAELEHHIASRLHERQAAAITNFHHALPADDAEAVQRITRDPVVLDFVQLAEESKERDLEAALLQDIERFMLALGEGFYFAGRQKSLVIGNEEFILDLLFYHHPTRRFVVIDLKIGRFQAEFAGKMNLYVNAVNALIAHREDRPTVGFILCAGRDEAVAHLTLQGISTPIAVTRYTVGKRGVLMAGEEAQVTEGIEEEMVSMRRLEQQVAEFTARRARELAEGSEGAT